MKCIYKTLLVVFALFVLTAIVGPNGIKAKDYTYIPKIEANVGNLSFDEIKLPELESEPAPELINLGEFRISWYCGCEICNGPNPGVDAHDTPLREGVVACNDIPQFSHILIDFDGELQEFEVRDRMASQYTGQNCIDIYTTDHNLALEYGIAYKNVYIKN